MINGIKLSYRGFHFGNRLEIIIAIVILKLLRDFFINRVFDFIFLSCPNSKYYSLFDSLFFCSLYLSSLVKKFTAEISKIVSS